MVPLKSYGLCNRTVNGGWGKDRICKPTIQIAILETLSNEESLNSMCAKHVFCASPAFLTGLQLRSSWFYSYRTIESQEKGLLSEVLVAYMLRTDLGKKRTLISSPKKHPLVKRARSLWVGSVQTRSVDSIATVKHREKTKGALLYLQRQHIFIENSWWKS